MTRALAAGALVLALATTAGATSLRFFGNGTGDIDRLKIAIDDPDTVAPGPPADVGASDFTIELWLKATAAENDAGAVSCGDNIAWINGNILVDRDRYNQDRKFGLSIAGGSLVFGMSGDGTGDRTLCGSSDLLDGSWHHVAVARRRSDGWLWLWVDGQLEDDADGPDGDVSYPDDGVPGSFCGGPCDWSDPFIVVGAEKHDAGSAFPSYSGWVDELRLSTTLRYTAPFVPASSPFTPDAATAALYHLDEGGGLTAGDALGTSDGELRVGGSPAGPVWSTDTPFVATPGDGDGDGLLDEEDPCTLRLVGWQTPDGSRLDLKSLDKAPGLQTFRWKGAFVPAGAPALALHTEGANVRIEDGDGALLDVSVPAGLVGAHPSTPCDARDGWTVKGAPSNQTFTYKNFSGFLDASCSAPAEGLSLLVVKDRRATKKADVQLTVAGKNATLAPALPPSRLQAILALAAQPAPGTASPEAIAGECAELTVDPFTQVPPAPFCTLVPPGGATRNMLCRGP
jgi:hypothetical protein